MPEDISPSPKADLNQTETNLSLVLVQANLLGAPMQI